MDAIRKEKEITLDGEGQITFKITDKGLTIEMFQQDRMIETVDLYEMEKLRNWFIRDLMRDA